MDRDDNFATACCRGVFLKVGLLFEKKSQRRKLSNKIGSE